MTRQIIFSNGGGTQSTGIVALIVTGRLPKPDIAAIVDTGREKTATWEYVEQIHRPALASVGVDLHVVSHDYAKHDLMKSGRVLMPMYTTHGGSLSKLPTYCSNEWKKRPLMRWLREQGVKQARQWLGISIDESDRMKLSGVQWLENGFPLIDLGMSRDDCYSLVRQMGWPDPPKSSCFMCPHMGDAQWRHMKASHPADFAAAVEVEQELRVIDPTVYLHRSAMPLDQVALDAQQGLFDEDTPTCAADGCWL